MRDKKAEIENLLELEIRSDLEEKPIQQLNYVLKLVGLRTVRGKPFKRSGQKIYPYRLDSEALDRVEGIKAARRQTKRWYYVYLLNNWDTDELEDEWKDEDPLRVLF